MSNFPFLFLIFSVLSVASVANFFVPFRGKFFSLRNTNIESSRLGIDD